MGFRGAAPWGFEGQQQVGWDLKGQQRDLKAQQHGTGLSRGYFLYFSVTDFKPQFSLVKTDTFSIRMERC